MPLSLPFWDYSVNSVGTFSHIGPYFFPIPTAYLYDAKFNFFFRENINPPIY